MKRHLTSVMIAGLAGAVLFADAASANHRGDNTVLVGGAISSFQPPPLAA